VNKVVEIRKGSLKTFLGGIEDYLYKKRAEKNKQDSTKKEAKKKASQRYKKRTKKIRSGAKTEKIRMTKDLKSEVSHASYE
jgi:ATPase subunit of ABC transporter with duplicated ATPase domains